MTIDLSPPVAELTRIVAGIRDDQLGAPTPNSGRDVATLLAHVHGLAIAFHDAAHKIDGPTTSTSPTDDDSPLPEDWRTAVPDQLARLAEAWKAPAAWEGMSKAGGVADYRCLTTLPCSTAPSPTLAGTRTGPLPLRGADRFQAQTWVSRKSSLSSRSAV